MPIYIDIRQTGSNTSIYSDFSLPFSQRATSICNDILGAIHDELLRVVAADDSSFDLSVCGPILDRLAGAIANTKVMGTASVSTSLGERVQRQDKLDVSASLPSTNFTAGISSRVEAESTGTETAEATGTKALSLIFGDVGRPLTDLSKAMNNARIWVLLDEWSELPLDLQSILADLIRRALLPIGAITVKIAAIEHRSSFANTRPEGGYVGFEIGADIGADLNLDDFMVFENDAQRASDFFANLLFKHYMSSDERTKQFGSPNELRSFLFTQSTAFDEFVRAVEGVPRDAIYLISMLSTKAFGHDFSVSDVRTAAREWYQRDKAVGVSENPDLQSLLDHIIEEVIGHRRARAFLVSSKERDPLIAKLFDMRLLHILKKNISSHDNPGERYDVYKIDYGCYVDLINTAKAPSGLLLSDEGYVDVPPDDYRSIRRAILDLGRFAASAKTGGNRASQT